MGWEGARRAPPPTPKPHPTAVDVRKHVHPMSTAVALSGDNYCTVMTPFMFMARCGVQT
jgi:hypothetical protein